MNRVKFVVAVLASLMLPMASLAAGVGHGDFLHFSHPLFAESPSPDTKIRADYIFLDGTGDERGETHSAQFEAEYALRPWFSIEAAIPFTFRNPDGGGTASNLDTIEIEAKLAIFSLAEHGVLLGGGIELELPTGDSGKMIGSSHIFEVVPFFDFGFKHEDGVRRRTCVRRRGFGFLEREYFTRVQDCSHRQSESGNWCGSQHPGFQ